MSTCSPSLVLSAPSQVYGLLLMRSSGYDCRYSGLFASGLAYPETDLSISMINVGDSDDSAFLASPLHPLARPPWLAKLDDEGPPGPLLRWCSSPVCRQRRRTH